MKTTLLFAGLLLSATGGLTASALTDEPPVTPNQDPPVTVTRIPGGGVQPRIAVGEDGAVHMVFLRGDEDACDVFYARSADGEAWSEPIRVNSVEGSARASGSITGPHLALGAKGRVHVAWNAAGPTGQDMATLYYTRSNEAGDGFEPQRDVMVNSSHLDGGCSIAADGEGRVHVVWHAQGAGEKPDELKRRVYVASSADEGATFAPERSISRPGVCACCALAATVDGDGKLQVLYRAAHTADQRGMRWLKENEEGSFDSESLDEWKLSACPVSTCDIRPAGTGYLLAWEGDAKVHFRWIDAPRTGGAYYNRAFLPQQKHPAIAVNGEGAQCEAWVALKGWGAEGTLCVEMRDAFGRFELPETKFDPVPKWGTVAVFAKGDGGFVVVY